MDDTTKMALVGLIAAVVVLSALSRRYPHVEWLQFFRWDRAPVSDAKRAAARRRANVYAGVELILLGVVLPFGYVALTILCIALGVTAIWRK